MSGSGATAPTVPVVRVLGAIRVPNADGGTSEPVGLLPKRLIVALALAGEAGRSAGALADEIWPDALPRNPRGALQMLVSRVRAIAAEGTIGSTATGYRLGASDLDLAESAARLLPIDVLQRIRVTSAELARWTGRPAGDLDDDLGLELQSRADRVRQTLLTARAGALLTVDRPDDALVDLSALQAANPFDSTVQQQRMRALAAVGRPEEAIAEFAVFRARLADELGADPSEALVRLNTALLTPDEPPVAIGLVTAPNALLGRDRELVTLARMVAGARLVTVLGTGGLGKTRLAQAAGRQAIGAFDQVAFVELAGVGSADVLPLALGAALGIREVRARRIGDASAQAPMLQRIREALALRPRTLLILDNCEHIVDGVAQLVAELLGALPDLTVLTTSRVALEIQGEALLPLDSLDSRTTGRALFVERATAVRPGAHLDADLVEHVCRRLDGLPLAIELAAARIRTMTLEELALRLDDGFSVLVGGDRTAPERHRTIHSVIEWSHRLLGPAAQRALAMLAVFPDGFGRGAAEVVVGRGADAAVDDLAQQSLLTLDEQDGALRFRMLETIREFGLRRLDEAGLREEATAALDRWAIEFALGEAAALGRSPDGPSMRAAAREEETLIAVLRLPPAGREDAVISTFALLSAFWSYRDEHGAVVEYTPVLIEAMRLRGSRRTSMGAPVIRALTLVALTALFARQPEATRALALLRRELAKEGGTGDGWAEFGRLAMAAATGAPVNRALVRAARSDDPVTASMALVVQAQLQENGGWAGAALRNLERAIVIAERHDLAWQRSMIELTIAQLASQRGDPARALATASETRARLEGLTAVGDMRQLDWLVGSAEVALGRLDDAAVRFTSLLDVPRSTGETHDDVRSIALAGLAEIAVLRGDREHAAELWRMAVDRAPIDQEMNPWPVMVRTAALASIVGSPIVDEAGVAMAEGLARRLRDQVGSAITRQGVELDLPVLASELLTLGAWASWRGARSGTTAAVLHGDELMRLGRRHGARLDMPSVAALAADLPAPDRTAPLSADARRRIRELLGLDPFDALRAVDGARPHATSNGADHRPLALS